MTQLEKASYVLNAQHDTPSEEVGGRLYINVSEYLNVAIHDEEIHYLAECYDELNQ
tara:strand:- start:56 stop:223 length:168 start_codon:yes stop_codon:yes gene_type:complete